MKPIKLVFQMQHAALEISDHRVISRVIQQRFRNLVFESVLPQFKISNMVWFSHYCCEKSENLPIVFDINQTAMLSHFVIYVSLLCKAMQLRT